MNASDQVTPGLDELADAARNGDAAAESRLFEILRVRFTAVAKQRVQADDLDDVVQDALEIVHAKHRHRRSRAALLVWSLAVLRHVIGNYYQSRARERGRLSFDQEHGGRVETAAGSSDPSYPERALAETDAMIRTAVGILARDDSRCARIFHAILRSLDEAGGSREVSQHAREAVLRDEPDLTRGAFYVALHRCRARLRAIVAELEAGSPGTRGSAPS